MSCKLPVGDNLHICEKMYLGTCVLSKDLGQPAYLS